MLDITAVAGKVAGIVSIASYIPYTLAILRGKKPNRATWWIWAIVSIIAGIDYHDSGADSTMFLPLGYIVGSLTIATLTIWRGEGGWEPFDRKCLFGVGVSVVLRVIFNSPLIGLITILFIDFMGALPTIRKVYHEPRSEDRTAWVLFFVGNVINLFAVEKWTFAIAVYPIYMLITVGLIAGFIFFRRNDMAKAKEV